MNDPHAETLVRRLEQKHRSLDQLVAELDRRAYLTPNEQRHIAQLKKEKLRMKDRLLSLRGG